MLSAVTGVGQSGLLGIDPSIMFGRVNGSVFLSVNVVNNPIYMAPVGDLLNEAQ